VFWVPQGYEIWWLPLPWFPVIVQQKWHHKVRISAWLHKKDQQVTVNIHWFWRYFNLLCVYEYAKTKNSPLAGTHAGAESKDDWSEMRCNELQGGSQHACQTFWEFYEGLLHWAPRNSIAGEVQHQLAYKIPMLGIMYLALSCNNNTTRSHNIEVTMYPLQFSVHICIMCDTELLSQINHLWDLAFPSGSDIASVTGLSSTCNHSWGGGLC